MKRVTNIICKFSSVFIVKRIQNLSISYISINHTYEKKYHSIIIMQFFAIVLTPEVHIELYLHILYAWWINDKWSHTLNIIPIASPFVI